MRCEKCQTEIESGDFFCKHCGSPIQLVPNYNILEEELLSRIVEDKSSTKEKFAEGVYKDVKKEEIVVSQPVPEKKFKSETLEKIISSKFRVPFFCILGTLVIVIILIVIITSFSTNTYEYNLNKALNYDLHKKYTNSLEYYKEAYNLKPDFLEAQINLGMAYYRVNDYKNCVEYLSKAVQSDPNPDIYSCLLKSYSQLGQEDEITKLAKNTKDENILSMINEYISIPPVFSVESGTYDDYISLVITCPADSQIFYTSNGKDPTAAGKLYTKPIQLTDVKNIIKAVALNKQGKYSEVITKDYIIEYKKPSMPKVTPNGGVFTSADLISIDVPENATAYYTWDASVPNKSSFVYSAPFEIIPGHHILSVKIIDSHGNESSVYTGDFNLTTVQ